MTVGIKTQDGGIILFSAVTSRSESYGGSVTSHPIENGSKISDHIVTNNPSFSIDGVISAVDFGGVAISIGFDGDEADNLTVSVISTFDNTVPLVSIEKGQPSRLAGILPEGIGAFLAEDKPKITLSESVATPLLVTKNKLIALRDKSELVQVFFMDGSVVKEIIDGCFVTSLSFSESAMTGEALQVGLSFEKVTVVTLDKSVVPALTWREIRTASAPTTKKGKKDSKGAGQAPANVPPETPATVEDFSNCKLDYADNKPGTNAVCWRESLTLGAGDNPQ